jgi:hypothetical protein
MFHQLRSGGTEMQLECCREHQDIEQCQNNKETKNLPFLRPLTYLRTLDSMCPTATEHKPQNGDNGWSYCVQKQLVAEWHPISITDENRPLHVLTVGQ